jgi:predicted PurR-regulated permease PerM
MDFSLDKFYQLNRRALIWIILLILIFLLRDFFGMVFLTFVFAFLCGAMVKFSGERLGLPRRPAILFVYGLFLVILASILVFVIPRVNKEAWKLIDNLGEIQQKVVDQKNFLVKKYPTLDDAFTSYLSGTIDPERHKWVQDRLRSKQEELGLKESDIYLTRSFFPSDEDQSASRVLQIKINKYRNHEETLLLNEFNKAMVTKGREFIIKKVPNLIHVAITVLLSLLFGFLIMIDLSRLGREVASLRQSRLHDFYEQTARPVVRFAYVVGRAIQAQAAIAVINTIMTLIGMYLLGIPSLAMLSVIVFFCSFIPVAGVFISTTPIMLVALNSEGGMTTAILSIVMVMVVHVIEAYGLNPLIYGKHMKINPVLVLIILFLGHHLFGIWGVLLGVPVAHYFIHDVFGVPVWSEKRMAPPPGGETPDPDSKPLSSMQQHKDPLVKRVNAPGTRPGAESESKKDT